MSEEKRIEKRRFSRIPFDADILLTQNKQEWRTKLEDISLNGVLAGRPDKWDGAVGEKFHIEIFFTNGGSLVSGEVCVAHMEEDHVGLQITNLDIDSAAHLRRLVELNLADPELLNRELSALHWK